MHPKLLLGPSKIRPQGVLEPPRRQEIDPGSVPGLPAYGPYFRSLPGPAQNQLHVDFIEFLGFVLECQNSNKQLKNRAIFEHLFGALPERPRNDFQWFSDPQTGGFWHLRFS